MDGRTTEKFRELCRERMRGNTLRRGKKMPQSAREAIAASLTGNKNRTGIPHPERERHRMSTSMIRAHAEGRHPVSASKRERNVQLAAMRDSGATFVQCGSRFGVSQYTARNIYVRLKARQEREQ